MKRRSLMTSYLPALLSLVVCSASANGVSYSCSSTVDLRPGGTADTIRFSNQSNGTFSVGYRIVNANGATMGNALSINLGPRGSATKTVWQIFQEAGLNSYYPTYFVQIGSVQQNFWPLAQSTYKNSATGQVVGILFSCGEPVPG